MTMTRDNDTTTDEPTTESFERTFSFWDAGIAPENLVGRDNLEITVTDATISGERGDEELSVSFEVKYD
jgi:hypothetical protein